MLYDTLLHGTHEKIECSIDALSVFISNNLITLYYMLVYIVVGFFSPRHFDTLSISMLASGLSVRSDLFSTKLIRNDSHNHMKFTILILILLTTTKLQRKRNQATSHFNESQSHFCSFAISLFSFQEFSAYFMHSVH